MLCAVNNNGDNDGGGRGFSVPLCIAAIVGAYKWAPGSLKEVQIMWWELNAQLQMVQ